MGRPPFILISPNFFPAEDRHFYKNKALEYGERSMAESVRQAGAVPIMPYRVECDEALETMAEHLMERCDALVLSGGTDISPTTYGDTAQNEAWGGDPARDRFEAALYSAAVERGLPVLGVCRGAQLINAAEGGTLWQDIVTLRPDSEQHRCQDRYDSLGHALEFDEGSLLKPLFEGEPRWVNSVHHQALREVAPTLTVIAHAPDGVIEAFVRQGESWVVGVQWHPEWMPGERSQRRLFELFVDQARRR